MVKMMFKKSKAQLRQKGRKLKGQSKVHDVEVECRWGRESI